jgi:hypothetical protein
MTSMDTVHVARRRQEGIKRGERERERERERV